MTGVAHSRSVVQPEFRGSDLVTEAIEHKQEFTEGDSGSGLGKSESPRISQMVADHEVSNPRLSA
jgi:hypothetical protein